ncbi:sensor histidine kinase [Sphingomonas suaedae]|uniref:histidine kinase n=1 Tax=Sphingomonas suaedae TaxID=2599297 RepID=A0A518RC08_9SPHN|nr:histidine kinase dimerization/phospho-acceptor domain-containing protein [Sphingomonas suaedae]QDX25000.1 sensor histidine kinase [Sphingomonas suaedae]
MRYDDTLETVLAADVSTSFGKASAWRQLVDLIGRRRVAADARAFNLLRRIRDEVPVSVRAASARALETVNPPGPLVALCALDDIAVAAPVLRSAKLSSGEWVELLPRLSSAARTVLRARRDLPPGIDRALESFGAVDFVIADGVSVPDAAALPEASLAPVETAEPVNLADHAALTESLDSPDPVDTDVQVAEPVDVVEPDPPLSIDWTELLAPEAETPSPAEAVGMEAVAEIPPAEPRARIRLRPVLEPVIEAEPEPETASEPVSDPVEAEAEMIPAETSTFVAIGAAALGIPVVAEALGRVEAANDSGLPQSGTSDEPPVESAVAPESDPAQVPDMSGDALTLADRDGAAVDASAHSAPEAGSPEGPFEIAEVVARIDAFYTLQQQRRQVEPPPRADGFRFETDEQGVIRWIDGVSRAPLIGLSLELNANGDGSRADGVAAGALRQRAPFADARLTVVGESDAAGEWRMSAAPAFDPATGRFSGYRGTARRPRREENAAAPMAVASPAADSLRQLMHELRTPTNAIAGFAEMIEREMLGDAPPFYRERAGTIRMHARALLAAIDDLDIAARIEASALQLSDSDVALRPLLSRIADDLAALAELRGAWIALPVDTCAVRGDSRAIERMLARMVATLVSAAGDGERIGVQLSAEADLVSIRFDRPAALTDYADEAVFGIDDEQEDAALLGTGFALRLVRNIARELSGQFITLPDAFVIQLPATVTKSLEQAR